MVNPTSPASSRAAAAPSFPDPYSPLPDSVLAHPEADAPPSAGEEPNTTGTLFLMIIFLMMIAGFWAILYLTLLHR